MPYRKPLTLPNLVCLLPCLVANPICHHIAIVILTPLIMFTTADAPHAGIAAPLAAPAVVLAVVTAMITIITKITP